MALRGAGGYSGGEWVHLWGGFKTNKNRKEEAGQKEKKRGTYHSPLSSYPDPHLGAFLAF
jgi:hypothetical protein